MTAHIPVVLFVDDVPQVLDALRNRFFRRRRSWDMRFVTSGEEALELMASVPVDLIVSDMRMPGMDGVDLMLRVREEHATAVRFILSGQASEGRALQATHIVHQYFTKPVEAEILEEAIASALRHRVQQARRDALGEVIRRLELTPLSDAMARVAEVLEQPIPDPKALARVIAEDPVLTGRVLSVSNSALFRRRGGPVSDVQTAVLRMGMEPLRTLLLGAEALGEFTLRDAELERVLRADATRAAEHAASLAPPSMQASAYAAGLLQDIGLLVLCSIDPCFQPHVVPEEPALQLEAEQEVFGVTHAEAGSIVLEAYGLPPHIVRVAAEHHDPPSHDDDELLAIMKRASRTEQDSEAA